MYRGSDTSQNQHLVFFKLANVLRQQNDKVTINNKLYTINLLD